MDIKESGRLNLEVINANGFDPPRWTTKTLAAQSAEIVRTLVARGVVAQDGQAQAHAADVVEQALRERDTIVQKLILIYTEVTEAEAAVHGNGADPLAEELADIAIRVTGLLWGLWGDDWVVRGDGTRAQRMFAPIEVQLRPIRDYLTHAVEAWRKDRRADVKIALEIVLKETAAFAGSVGIDLVGEMERKREKNAARPPRHGNKRSDG